MIALTKGDRLPTVATVQLLLNSAMPEINPPLVVDGAFGSKTENAVIAFHRNVMQFPGHHTIVGPAMWEALTDHHRLQVRDIVDTFDNPVGHELMAVVQQAGSTPIVFGGMSNAVSVIPSSLQASGVQPGTLALLRIQGHGNRGSQVVGYGTTVHIIFDAIRGEAVPDSHALPRDPADVGITPEELAQAGLARSRSNISNRSLDLPEVDQAMRQLKPYFAECGSLELHGCQVGGGSQGRQFVRRLANLLGVPVSAARVRQLTSNAIRFDPPILTVCPWHKTLSAWGQGLTPIRSSSRP